MQRLLKAIQLTSDGTPAGELDDDALSGLYRYPTDLSVPYVRSNMIASLDGSAERDGRSGGLGGPGDRLLFGILRQLAEVVVVGSGTVNSENYRPDPRVRIAVVSASLRLTAPVMADPSTIVLTCRQAPADRRAELIADGVTVIDCGSDRVEPPAIIAAMNDLGLRRVLTEGGPSLLGSLLAFGLVDEMCVTTAPLTIAGSGRRITAGPTADRRFVPAHVLTDDDGYLYTRWTTSPAR
jgi:5-amino-6-(5-phosphoribosylamino)uracil reductase